MNKKQLLSNIQIFLFVAMKMVGKTIFYGKMLEKASQNNTKNCTHALTLFTMKHDNRHGSIIVMFVITIIIN